MGSKIEERTQDETLTGAVRPQRDAWELATDVYKLKKRVKKERSTLLPRQQW